jgi:hypothetical protein
MPTSAATTLLNDFLALVHPLFATVASSIICLALRVVVRTALLLNVASPASPADYFVVFPDLLAGFLVDEDVAAVAVGPLGTPV